MTVYVLAQLKFTNRSAYDRYQARFMSVLKAFAGRLLAADERPRVLEGECTYDKIVLLQFADEDNFRRWSSSPEYQEILNDRKAGADANVLLLHGANSPRV